MAGISIDDMAEEIMDGLQEYSELADSAMKKAVQKTASQVRKEISENAPERTGKYGKSWTTKKVAEKSHSLQIVVHSKNRYQIAHLLENGHAKRNGGRVEAQPHIAPAEKHGSENFDELLKKYLN
ncbi:MAG: HK97 gp10 family phage protein [Oscillospiraceae bacterium]|nr:HK97 gp10 family phage protein [Oscillospiraceae bacterium]